MRKIRFKFILLCLLIITGLLFLFNSLINEEETNNPNNPLIKNQIKPFDSFLEGESIGHVLLTPSEYKKLDTKKLFDEYYFSYKQVKEFDFKINSYAYVLADLDNRDILYGKNYDEILFPASLTKLITLDAVLNNVIDLNDTSSLNDSQYNDLVRQNASLAHLKVNHEYTIKDLLYALVLPSGADAAVALENYFEKNENNLVNRMNERCIELGCVNTVLFNTTGLHDDNHIFTLSDYLKVIKDILRFEEGRNILNAFEYTLETGNTVKSTLISLKDIEKVKIFGGKTGYTSNAGQCICVLYEYENKEYLLVLAKADGSYLNGEHLHLDDVSTIIENLY